MLHLPYIREYPRQVQKGILDKGEIVDLKPLLKLDMGMMTLNYHVYSN